MTGGHYVVVGSAPAYGAVAAYSSIIGEADVVIAADGGIELCLATGRMPDLLVGDLDSVSPSALARAREAGVRIIVFPAEKDESDLDLALAIARDEGAGRVTFTAAFSGRIDHTLAALGTLARSADLDGEAREPLWRAYALDSRSRPSVQLHDVPGTVLSVMACHDDATVSIAGVRYPLVAHRLESLSSLGLSNIAEEDVQRIDVHEGSIVVIVNRDVS